MPVTLAHRIQFFAAWLLLKLFRIMGVDASSWVAGKFLRILGPFLKRPMARGEENLRRAYPAWTDHQIRKTMGEVWESLGRVGGEFAHLDKFKPTWNEDELRARVQNITETYDLSQEQLNAFEKYKPQGEKARVRVDASEDFLHAMALQKPVIFASAHLSNWEVMSVVCGYFDVPCALVYRASNNPMVDELIINQRAKMSPHRQIPKGPDGTRALIDALKDQYSLALMMDQKFKEGVKVSFFGRGAFSPPAPARMALNYQLPIIPVTIRRTSGVQFDMTVHDAIKVKPTGDVQADIADITQQINSALEKEIRKAPGQWLWVHRRWG